MMSHELARLVIEEAADFKGYPLTLAGKQLAQALGWQESGYSSGWHDLPEGYGNPHNWGAVQCPKLQPCPPDCFPYGDSHEDRTPYAACFRVYSDDVAGAAGMLHEMHRRPRAWAAMNRGDAIGMADAMKHDQPIYFELADWKGYGRGLAKRADAIAKALGEPSKVGASGGGSVSPWIIGGGVLAAAAAVIWWAS